jgi:hypothetical protein
MNLFKSKILNIFSASLLFLSINTFANAEQISLPGFTGNINTTVSSGFTMRVGEQDCELVAGYNAYASTTSTDDNYIGASLAALIGARSGNSLAGTVTTPYGARSILHVGEKQYGCATRRVDGFGNTSIDTIDYTATSSDDGRMNFKDQGDIVDATQMLYSEIIGVTDAGLGVNLSLVTSVNPVLDITDPDFKKLTAKAENQLDHDFKILNAYVTQSYDTENSYVDVTAGRFVTSWGEATFIPVGMNGLVTNALDLTKLRAPGASIKEALVPTEQISLNFGLGNGMGLEVYTQFSADQVVIDPRGSYFGSDLMTGSQMIQAAGANDFENGNGGNCDWLLTAATSGNYYGINGEGLACNTATVAKSAANFTTYHGASLLEQGLRHADSTDWSTSNTYGQSAPMAAHDSDAQTTLTVAGTMAMHSDSSQIAAAMQNLTPYQLGLTATLNIKAHADKFVDARDDGQYGVALRGYSDVGNGIDWGLYFSNYHSKVPYVQFVGKKGIFAGDVTSILLDVAGDLNSFIGNDGVAFDPSLGSNLAKTGATAAIGGDLAGSAGLDSTDATQVILAKALVSNMYGSVCSSLGKVGLQSAFGTTLGLGALEGKEMIANGVFNTLVDNKLVSNSQACYKQLDNNATNDALNASTTSQGTLGAFIQSTAILTGAIAPLSEVKYQFIYPEDNQVFGISGNTNIGSTMVNGEITFRPDFPMSTNGWDQIAQIQDVSGVTGGLTAFAIHNTIAGMAALTCVTAANTSGSSTSGFCDATTDGGDPLATKPTKATVQGALSTWVDGVDAAYVSAGINLAGTSTQKSFKNSIKEARRSSLTPILQSTAEAGDYNSTAFIEKDVWSGTFGTTTTFNASHPITQGLGADGTVLLSEFAVVSVQDYNPKFGSSGYIARGTAGFNEGSGEYLCLGAFADLSAATQGAIATSLAIDNDFGTDAASGIVSETFTNMGSGVVDALFGNGSYCEGQNGIDSTSMTYRVVGSANYFNVANSDWNLSPSFVWSHDPMGYGPASLGGFSEGRMSLSLNLNFSKGDAVKFGLNYVNELGDPVDNSSTDKDYMSATMSYAF